MPSGGAAATHDGGDYVCAHYSSGQFQRARLEGSVSRELSQLLSQALAGESGTVTVRDLAETPVPQVDAGWVGANFTDPAERTKHSATSSKGLTRSWVS
ncbi:MAG: NAD(P)H-dependent oxidoreductase [Oceanicaulis sp.]|nr:NAD(P)H-dependent oxidoreductase [Oceanicaulis sp.]